MTEIGIKKSKNKIIDKGIHIKKKYALSTENALLLMALPFIIFIIVFCYVPLLGWSMAFVKYIPGLPIFKSKFVGLDNFKYLFGFASDFPRILQNTLVMSFLSILASPVPLVFAILLTEIKNTKFKKFIQTTTSLPNFISMVIVFALFFQMFNLDGGFINELLMKLHLIKEPINLLGNPDITWYFQTFVGIWKSTGWGAIIYIAAISSVDSELYEAASIDGAGRFKKILNVTLPGVISTYLVLLLLGMANLLSGSFEQVYVFHNGLVASRIENLDYYSYKIGLGQFDFSLSTAIGMFKSVVSVMLLFIFSKISKKLTGNSVI